ncbi:MAG TPA: zinc metallopeptidase [Anaerolineae bacterium]|nr:zinc metallopeptidase [Anaerolineae bacterium]
MFMYLLFALPAMLLGMWAQYKVKSNYRKYAQVGTSQGLTGAQVARQLLDAKGLQHVRVEEVSGFLSDHYDPRSKVLRLSPEVYRTPSVAAAGIAAHEMGHALQDAQSYAPLKARTALVPGVQVGGWVGPLMLMIGLIFSLNGLAILGLILFSATAVFALVTLPVEFDASRRAKALLESHNILFADEMVGVNKVLDAAALTYVAAAIQALSTVLYYAFIIFGSRD